MNFEYAENIDNQYLKPISLSDFWNNFIRHKKLIAMVITVSMCVALIYYMTAPRFYMARAVVLLENQKRDVQIKSVLTSDANDLMLIPSEIQVLISQNLMGKVVDRLGLVDNPTMLTNYPNKNAQVQDLPKMERATVRTKIILQILKDLKVRQVERSRALEIAYEGRNPVVAADIVNTLTQLYIEQQLNSNLDAVRITNNWLSGRVKETQAKLREADMKVAQYRENSGIVDSRGIDLIEQNISDLSNKLTEANAQVAAAQARLGQIKDVKSLSSAPEILSAPLIQKLRDREAEARDQLAALQDQLGPDHPRVKTARAQVGEIDAKIKQEISKLAQGLHLDYQASVENADNIKRQLDSLKVQYNKFKNDNVGLNALEAEATTYRNFLETLNLRFKETQSQDDSKFQTPYARIISPATVPEAPSSPDGELIMATALFIGLMSGLGAALAKDIIGQGIYNGSQIQRVTGMLNISVIVKDTSNPGKSIERYADIPMLLPFSPYMQGIKAISMFIRMNIANNSRKKIYNFTSSANGEGKTALVMSTAQQLALEGLKVLSVDCDTQRQTLSHTFGLSKKSGLMELLNGSANLKDVVFRDGKTGAAFISAGETQNIAGYNIEACKKVFDEAAALFDVVLLDSPPITSTPESLFTARLSQNIVCVKWQKTPVKLLNFALDTMKRWECPVSGTVITFSEK